MNDDDSDNEAETAEYSKMYCKFLDRVESRIVKSWVTSWFSFIIKFLLYGLATFVCSASVLLYARKQISSTDFAYVMPLSALSSAALIYTSSLFSPEKRSEILLDVGVDLISEFLPTSKRVKKFTYRTRS
jgi:hypothetical protein